MTRRLLWFGFGAAAGSGATVWARRRVGRLARRVQSGQIAGEVVTLVDHGARTAARRRRRELHHDLEMYDLGR
jgi:hypothetical protein